jgi:membrane fusion protein, heavy metal efflux system
MVMVPKFRRLRLLVTAGVVALSCVALSPVIAGEEGSKDGSKPAIVKVIDQQLRQLVVHDIAQVEFHVRKKAIGQIAFNEDESTVIVSPFSGRVTKLLGKIGDTIERGAPLFEIDSPEVVQAQTDLIAAVQGRQKAQSQLGLATRTLARQTELLTSRATSQREVDQAKSDAAGAESDLKTSEGSLLSARNKLRVLVGRSTEEIARVERDRIIDPIYVVTAPIAGTIVSRKIGPGQYVRSDAAEPLFLVSDLRTMWLKASVPENDIPLVRVGQHVEVKVPALPDRIFKARVTAIGASSDSATRRVVVRSEIANPGGVLKAEMFATFTIMTGEVSKSPSVPVEAVIREGDLSAVWVERAPLTFQRRKVKIGVEEDNFVQILAGLNPGERVVGRGAIFIDNEWRQ